MKIKTLLVDDSPETLQVLQMQYGLCEDIEVVGDARTVDEALVKLSALQVDMVSIDIQLGTESGLDLCATVRQAYPSVFAVICSVEADDKMRSMASVAGANMFLAKPVSSRDLERLVQVFQVTSKESKEQPKVDDWFSDLLGTLPAGKDGI